MAWKDGSNRGGEYGLKVETTGFAERFKRLSGQFWPEPLEGWTCHSNGEACGRAAVRGKIQRSVQLDKPVGPLGRDAGQAGGTENASGVFRRLLVWQ